MKFIYASVNNWAVVDVIEDNESVENRGQELVDALMENVDGGFYELTPNDEKFAEFVRNDGTKEAKEAAAKLMEVQK